MKSIALFNMKRVRIDDVTTIFYYIDIYEGEKRYWETATVDRFRFERRIKEMEILLNPILNKKIGEIKDKK